MNRHINAGADAVAKGAEQIQKEISGAVGEAAGLAESYGAQKLERAREAFEQTREALTDGAKGYRRATDQYVRENPWKALGVAAAAGLLLGILLAGR